jgi:antitoxin component YwqK of YwqJK toxin-antitoxin module
MNNLLFTNLSKNMLVTLPYDIQYRILLFLKPEEIIALYESFEDVIQEMIKHTNFIVECKVVLSDEEIEWFETKKITVKLLEEYKIDERCDERCDEYWYKNGKLHHDNDLPAIIYEDGEKRWYKNGQIHRENDLPAVICPYGYQVWYKNGEFHRENDFPAIILPDGTQYWYKNGLLHRDNDLPAIICLNGPQEWYQNGVKYSPI